MTTIRAAVHCPSSFLDRACLDSTVAIRLLETSVQSFRFVFVLSLLAVSLGGRAVASPADVKAEAAAIDAHYNHLRSLQAEFTEVYRGSGMERIETGTLWLKKPGKMRWEYRSPREKLFVSDGKDAWFYVPADRQARKTAAKKLEDVRSPLAFLLGKTKLEKELQGLSLAPDVAPFVPGNLVLRGVPQALADRVNEILLEITPDHQIARIVIQEVDGAATEYRFGDMKEDAAVGDGRFQFKPPAGTETVEGGLEP
jgi:outer membrane lipoprotein carrier protein